MSMLIDNLLDVTRARSGERLPALWGALIGEWDKARVGQVFSNLINNAIQYSFQ